MSIKTSFVVGLLFLFVSNSCSKKDHDIKPNYPVEGNYVGNFSVLNGSFEYYYSFSVKTGGVLEMQDMCGQKTGKGQWTISDDNVLCANYALSPTRTSNYSFCAKFDNVTGKLNGTWTQGMQENNGGHLILGRTN